MFSVDTVWTEYNLEAGYFRCASVFLKKVQNSTIIFEKRCANVLRPLKDAIDNNYCYCLFHKASQNIIIKNPLVFKPRVFYPSQLVTESLLNM